MALPQPALPRPGRLPSLDGWRAIAILLVVGSHIPFSSDCPPTAARMCLWFFDGNLGVRLFFTISGFIITWLLLEEQRRTGAVSLRDFYLRRTLRIVPVYAAYLLCIFLLQRLGRCDESATSWAGSLTFLRNLLGRGDSATVHLWSLAIEEQFYALWPATFVILKLNHRRRLAFWLFGLVVVAAIVCRFQTGDGSGFLNRLNGERSLFRYMDSLSIGCFAAYLWSATPGPGIEKGSLFAATALILTFVGSRITWQGMGLVGPFVPSLQAAAFAWLMLWTLSKRSMCFALLNSRPAVALGLLSYSFYIWHLFFVDHFAPRALPFRLLNTWWLWPFLALATAWLSWSGLERPMQKLRKRVAS
jgi:peptidoglycan/LPS O-acetylase OafA/YrhL